MKSAKELVKFLQTRGEIRYSRRLHSNYGQAEVEFAGVKIKLFFCRKTKNGDWNGLLTTNTKLDFFEAYHTYLMRWSIEVFFKEAKGLLGLRKSHPETLHPRLPAYPLRHFSTIFWVRSNASNPMKLLEDFSTKPQME